MARRKFRRSPKSDPQQYRVYKMENQAIGCGRYAEMTVARQEMLLRSLARNCKIKPVKLRRKDMGPCIALWQAPDTIYLNPKLRASRDLVTITHEFAHHLHYSIAKDIEHQTHGPQFMACHMFVLDMVRHVPVAAMRVICDAYGVKYHDPGTRLSRSSLRRAVLR